MKLSNSDYKTILKYYDMPINKNKQINKVLAEHILATKLCRCIKKVSNTSKINENKAIGICTNSIFKRRNLKYNKFSCKKGFKLKGNKTHKILQKMNKIKFKYTRKRKK